MSHSMESSRDAGSGTAAAAARALRWQLAALVVGSIVFHVVASFSRKVMYDAYGDKYVFFRAQLTNLLYNTWATTIIIGRAALSRDFRRSFRESTRKFHPCLLTVPALLDGLGNFLDSVAGPSVPGSWTVLLGQSTVFFTMLFAFVLMSAHFNRRQVLGAVLTVVGACMAVLPEVIAGTEGSRHAGYALIFFSADIPVALSAVFKDYAFKRGNLDVFYLTAMVSWVQLGVTWFYLPLLKLPAFGGMDLHSIPEVMSDGAACFFGDTSIPVYNAADDITGYCSHRTTLITLVYSLSGFTAGICQLFVLKLGSASLCALSMALAVPITNFAFDVPYITQPLGLHSAAFSWWNFAGVFIVVAGFTLYALNGVAAQGPGNKDLSDSNLDANSDKSSSAPSDNVSE